MNGLVLPALAAVIQAVKPVQAGGPDGDEEQECLTSRQLRERTATIFVKCDQSTGVMNIESERGVARTYPDKLE